MNKTGIEYLDYTWNPLAMRCTPVSEGCANCWHLRSADRLKENSKLSAEMREAYARKRPPFLVKKRLNDPLKVEKPSIIGVQFMGDLFHEDIGDLERASIWDVMRKGSHHQFLVLTKRPQNIASFQAYIAHVWNRHMWYPNVWLGVTVENQQRADERIPNLLQIPAAVHFVSYEPALGPVDLVSNLYLNTGGPYWVKGRNINEELFIDWIIAGGETAPHARPAHPDWFRSVRDQCQAAGVPFFFKHWGEWAEIPQEKFDNGTDAFFDPERLTWCYAPNGLPRTHDDILTNNLSSLLFACARRIGKRQAGCLLDGREWNEYPSQIKRQNFVQKLSA